MQKPNHTRSIVTKKAGEDVPEALLQRLCKENMSALGILIRDGSKMEYEKYGTDKNPMDDTPEAFFNFMKGILRGQKKKPMMIVFHSMPQEFDPAEIQPWIPIKDSKGNPMLAVALEGDFPGREVDGDSEMYGLMCEYLGPKIEEMYKFTGNNINKTINWLKGDSFANDLKNTYSHRAEFVFFPNEGDPFAIGKNELGIVSQTWGTCSNAYGYTEDSIEAETKAAEPAPARSKFASDEDVKPIKTDDNGIHTLPPDTAPEPEKLPVEIPKADPLPKKDDPIQNAADATAESHWETPPANLHGKELKKWYRAMNAKSGEMDPDGKQGKLNEDWNVRPRIFVRHLKEVKALSDLSHTALGSTVKNDKLPVISGADQAKVVDFIKKFTANQVINNPLEMQKEESTLALFSELCLTKGLAEINTWKVSTIEAFCVSYPVAAMLLIAEQRRRIINLEASLSVGDKKLGDLTGTEKPSTTAPDSKPLTPSPAPAEHAPRKTSKYA